MSDKRQAFFIPADHYVEGEGYIPGLATEGEPGYHLMSGRGEGAAPWVWGPTYDDAVATAKMVNAERGIDEVAALEILSSSMAAGRVQ